MTLREWAAQEAERLKKQAEEISNFLPGQKVIFTLVRTGEGVRAKASVLGDKIAAAVGDDITAAQWSDIQSLPLSRIPSQIVWIFLGRHNKAMKGSGIIRLCDSGSMQSIQSNVNLAMREHDKPYRFRKISEDKGVDWQDARYKFFVVESPTVRRGQKV